MEAAFYQNILNWSMQNWSSFHSFGLTVYSRVDIDENQNCFWGKLNLSICIGNFRLTMMNRLYQHLRKSNCNALSCLVVDRCYSVHNIFHLFSFFPCIYHC